MPRLAYDTLEWNYAGDADNFHKAEKQGDTPYVRFRIKDLEAVEQFFNNPDNTQFFNNHKTYDPRMNQPLPRTHCLAYTIEGDILTISRSVGNNTLAFASNQSLAKSLLLNIYDAGLSDGADIFVGLTDTSLPEEIEANLTGKRLTTEDFEGVEGVTVMTCKV